MKTRFKKLTILTMFFVFAAFFGGTAWGQNVVTIGNGSVNDNHAPIYAYDSQYSFSEQLYTAAEINQSESGYITKLGFKRSGSLYYDWSITVYMKAVDDDDLADGYINVSNSDIVYNGIYYPNVNNWNTIELDVPFYYDNTKNLLIAVDKDSSGIGGNYNWICTNIDNMARYSIAGSYIDPLNLPGGTVLSNRPNIQLTFESADCAIPYGVTATLTPGDGTVATLNWTAGSAGQTAWQVYYSTTNTTPANDINVAEVIETTSTTCDLTVLTAETPYYAWVRGDCGSGVYSKWSKVYQFTPTNNYVITLNDGGNINEFVPFELDQVGAKLTKGQFIIPASAISSLQWGTINKLTLYHNSSDTEVSDAEFDVYVKEVDYTVFDSETLEDWNDMFTAYGGTFSSANNKLEIAFATPYRYYGGNLMIGINETAEGDFDYFEWYGERQNEYTAISGYGTTYTRYQFLPKLTIEFDPGVEPTCYRPTDVTVSNVLDHTATISWQKGTEDQTAWQIYCSTSNVAPADDITTGLIDANTTTWPLDELDVLTTYFVWVRGNCSSSGNGYSDWSMMRSFTTLLCSEEDQCEISYVLTDAYDDGWQGASIQVVDDETGLLLATLKYDVAQVGNLALCDGRKINFIWVKGSGDGYYDDECGFTIYDPVGDEIVSIDDASDIDETPFATYTMNCPSCPAPKNISVSNITPYSAIIGWTSNASNFGVQYKKTSEEDWEDAIPEDTNCTLSNLDADTEYEVRVKAICGVGDESDWVVTTFATLVACPTPSNLVIDNLTTTSARVSWTGYNDSYTVAYRESTSFLNEGFEGGVMPDGWTTEGDDGLWVVGSGDNGSPTMPYSGNYNALGFYDGYDKESYLITPEMNLLGQSGLRLSCYYINKDWEGDNDYFGIYYRVNNGEELGEWQELVATTEEAHEEWTNVDVELIDLNDRYQIGFKVNAQYGHGVGLDNVIVGGSNGAEWNDDNDNVAEENFTMTGLTANTNYEIKVKSNCGGIYSQVSFFTTQPNNTFTTAGNWNTASNWSFGEVPTSTDDVVIQAECTIPSTCIAQANTITLDGGSITVEEGGQLVCSNSVEAILQKEVTGWDAGNETGWITISTPVHNGTTDGTSGTLAFANVSNLVAAGDQYNVYYFDESEHYWMNNLNDVTGFSTLNNGWGYIYRRGEDATLGFTGNTNVQDVTYTATAEGDNAELQGFNLIGNPFAHNITWDNLTLTNVEDDGCLRMDDNGAWILWTSDNVDIAPMEAFFVQANDDNASVTISNTASSAKGTRYANDNIMLTVNNGRYSDNACIMFKKGNGINKLEHQNAAIQMLYVINNGERYALADMPDNTSIVDLGFDTKTMGQYTISLEAEGQYNYIHLFDKLTGADVDMLVEDGYTFVGSQNDRKDRFELRFNYNTNVNTESDIFAYQNGNDIIVSGEGELQIFDVMGRTIKTQQVSGVETINVKSQGVYIFRLNGKTQKIVVR